MNKLDKRILIDLYKSKEGLFPFTFHSRYGITAGQVYSFIDKYEKKKVIDYNDNKINITKEGKKFLMKNRISLHVENKYSKIPKHIIVPKLKVNEFYIPKLSEIDKEILS